MTTNRVPATKMILRQVEALKHWASRSERVDEVEREAARHRLAMIAEHYILPGENGVMPPEGRTTAPQGDATWLYNPGAWKGAKYEQVSRMSLTEIAALMRADYKLARKLAKKTTPKPGEVALLGQAGELTSVDAIGDAPASIKVSIRTEYYSGGGSIDVMIKGIPQDWGWTEDVDRYGHPIKKATPAMAAFIAAVQEIHSAYNFDNSDAMTDYFHRNYYGHVNTENHIHVPRW